MLVATKALVLARELSCATAVFSDSGGGSARTSKMPTSAPSGSSRYLRTSPAANFAAGRCCGGQSEATSRASMAAIPSRLRRCCSDSPRAELSRRLQRLDARCQVLSHLRVSLGVAREPAQRRRHCPGLGAGERGVAQLRAERQVGAARRRALDLHAAQPPPRPVAPPADARRRPRV